MSILIPRSRRRSLTMSKPFEAAVTALKFMPEMESSLQLVELRQGSLSFDAAGWL